MAHPGGESCRSEVHRGGAAGLTECIPVSPIPAANVASVAQRSPLRYPGGKTWLIPHVRAWLTGRRPRPRLLIEPFCGGGIVSLSAVMEGWAERCLMAERDPDVAAFWRAALGCGPALAEWVRRFPFSPSSVAALAQAQPEGVLDRGFRTLVLNRTRRGGVLAPGAAFTRNGEAGRGLRSRWYPETLAARLEAIHDHRDRIDFREGDGMALLENPPAGAAVFADPPYTAGGKRAGRRLYAHHDLDHQRLFALLAEGEADFMVTYDEAPEIVALVERHGFHAVRVLMKNGHHNRIPELVITRRPVFERGLVSPRPLLDSAARAGNAGVAEWQTHGTQNPAIPGS